MIYPPLSAAPGNFFPIFIPLTSRLVTALRRMSLRHVVLMLLPSYGRFDDLYDFGIFLQDNYDYWLSASAKSVVSWDDVFMIWKNTSFFDFLADECTHTHRHTRFTFKNIEHICMMLNAHGLI